MSCRAALFFNFPRPEPVLTRALAYGGRGRWTGHRRIESIGAGGGLRMSWGPGALTAVDAEQPHRAMNPRPALAPAGEGAYHVLRTVGT